MRFAWSWAVALGLVACSSSFSAGPGGDAGSDATEENPTIQGDSGGRGMDATSPGDSGVTESGTEASTGDGGCTGLVCGGTCVPNDVHNCGVCGHDCTSLPHVSGPVSCTASGACSFPVSSCAPGWTQCLTNPDLGCETNIATTSNCGSCGNTCSGGTPSCAGTGSTYSCVSGCPGTEPTLCSGTCVDTTSDANDCSTCGNVCMTTMAHAQPTCVKSACSFACDTDYPLCDGACIDPTSDDNNCNGCGNKCTGGTHCVNSSCQCTGGLVDCSGTCTNTSSTVADCGACGHNCYGGACTNAVCQQWVVTKAPTTGAVHQIAADGQYFVWSDTSRNAVLDVPLTGGSAVSVYTTVPAEPAQGVAVANGHVLFLAPSLAGADMAIYSATAGVASSASVLTQVGFESANEYAGPVFDPTGSSSYTAFVDQGDDVVIYQCVASTCTALGNSGGLGTADDALAVTASSAAVFLLDTGSASGGVGAIEEQAPGGSISTVEAATYPDSLAVDAVSVYWVTAVANGSSVYTSSVYSQGASGTPKKLITLPAYVDHLVTDGTNLYFTVSSSSTATDAASIQYIPVGGATSTKTLSTGSVASPGLVAAAGAIYWVQGDDTTINGIRFP